MYNNYEAHHSLRQMTIVIQYIHIRYTRFLAEFFMWGEGMNTKPQIYYNNNIKKHASTPQATKRKKGKLDEDNVHWNIQK